MALSELQDEGLIMAKRRFKVLATEHRTRYSGTINANDLRKAFRIPTDADITFTVPSGGDWSGQAVDLDDGHVIHVSWEEVRYRGN
jgi:hypothetical protein